jgi:hypothetical protein
VVIDLCNVNGDCAIDFRCEVSDVPDCTVGTGIGCVRAQEDDTVAFFDSVLHDERDYVCGLEAEW